MYRPVAQLAERRSPKPQVGGSIPSWPAIRLNSGLGLNVRHYMNTNVETTSGTLDTIKLGLALLIAIAALVGFYFFADQSLLYRVLGLLAAAGS